MGNIIACDGKTHSVITRAEYHVEIDTVPDGEWTASYNNAYDYCSKCFSEWVVPLATGEMIRNADR